MSGQAVELRYVNNPNAPVDDADRALVEERLKQAFTEGAIDINTFFALLEQMWSAQIGGHLVPVLRALPASLRHTGPALGSDPVGVPPGQDPKGPSIFSR